MTKNQHPGTGLPGRGNGGEWISGRPFIAAEATPQQDSNHLAEPLQRLAWFRQELDSWNERGGCGDMPQPRLFDIPLKDLKPSEIHWRRVAVE